MRLRHSVEEILLKVRSVVVSCRKFSREQTRWGETVLACCGVLQRVAACESTSSQGQLYMGWLRLVSSLKL